MLLQCRVPKASLHADLDRAPDVCLHRITDHHHLVGLAVQLPALAAGSYAAGAVQPTEMPRFFNTGYQSASISMRSVLWG